MGLSDYSGVIAEAQTGAEIEALLDAELGNTDWKTGSSITERFVTGPVTAVINDALNVSGDCDITLPTANIGESFFIFDADIAFDTNDVKILQASGITINNIGNEDFQFDIKNVDAQVKKVSATNWRVF